MTQAPILDILADLGGATVHSLWLPVLVWTVLALPLWTLLDWTDRLHPNAEYRLAQVLLGALPLGVVIVGFVDLLPVPPSVPPSPELTSSGSSSVELPPPVAPQAVPSVETTTDGLALSWLQIVGLGTVAAGLWGLVRLGQILLDAVAALQIRRAMGRTEAVPSIQRCAEQIAERLGVNRRVRVALSPAAAVPVTIGGIRPMILLPAGLTEQEEALRTTLFHELVHIRRYDDLAHLVERVVAAVFGAHPLMGPLWTHIEEARERACDAAVLEEDATSPAAYARTLMAFAEERGRPGRLGVLSLAESPSSLADRIAALRPSGSNRLSSPTYLNAALVGLSLVLTLGIVACSDSVGPSVTNTDRVSSGLGSESVWTPIADARTAGSKWLRELTDGNPEQTYDDLLHHESVTRSEWTSWVERHRSEVGAVQSRTLESARLSGGRLGPSDPPSVRLGYTVAYESGTKCRLSLDMVMIDAGWSVADFASLFCDDGDKLPTSTAEPTTKSVSSGAHTLPTLVGGWKRQPGVLRGWKGVQEQVRNPEIAKKAQGRVLVEFIVGKDGHVTSARVKEKQGLLFTLTTKPGVEKRPEDLLYPAALRAIKSTSFTPGRLDGTPVRTRMQLSVHFNCATMRAAGLEKPCLPTE